jgi:hypothetical protein
VRIELLGGVGGAGTTDGALERTVLFVCVLDVRGHRDYEDEGVGEMPDSR